jgi:hypothetical protein
MKLYQVVNNVTGERYTKAIPKEEAEKIMTDLKLDRKMLEEAGINGDEWADDISISFMGEQ